MQACPHMPRPFICRHRTLDSRDAYVYGVDSGDDAVVRKDKEETYGGGLVVVTSAERGMTRRLARPKALLSLRRTSLDKAQRGSAIVSSSHIARVLLYLARRSLDSRTVPRAHAPRLRATRRPCTMTSSPLYRPADSVRRAFLLLVTRAARGVPICLAFYVPTTPWA